MVHLNRNLCYINVYTEEYRNYADFKNLVINIYNQLALYNLLINKYLYYIHNTVAVIDNNLHINNLVRKLRSIVLNVHSLV